MDIRKQAENETRTLGKYLRAKIGVSIQDFSKAESVPVSTLNDRWKSKTGKIRVMDAVLRHYINRFNAL
jgi:hypothetical protein